MKCSLQNGSHFPVSDLTWQSLWLMLLWDHNSIIVASCAFNGSIILYNLTHSGRVTHICVNKITIICSDDGLSPGRRQAIIWTNVVILLIEPLGTNFSEILIAIHIFSWQKMHLNMSSAKWRPSCLGLDVLCSLLVSFHGIPFVNRE